MMGCPVFRKCLVACWFGELSQHPTCPHVRQSRRCTHRDPVASHSSQPRALGVTVRIASSCSHASAIGSSPAARGVAATRPDVPYCDPIASSGEEARLVDALGSAMATKLEKALKRELAVDGEAYILTISPQ